MRYKILILGEIMSFFEEVPMGKCIHPLAKLYTRFTFNQLMSEEGVDIQQALTNFMGYKNIKWNFIEDIQKGNYQPVHGLKMDDNSTIIETNSVDNINVDDIIALRWTGAKNKKNGDLYVIAEMGTPKYIDTPNHRLARQYLKLKLYLDEVNSKIGGTNVK